MKLYAFLNNSVQKDIQESMKSVFSCGYANGYVAIPKEHPFYGYDYDLINKFVAVHGGLTFSEPMHDVLTNFNKTNIRGINCDFEDIPTDYWVVGFDTLHSGDDESLDAIWCTYETIRMMYQLKEKTAEKKELKNIGQISALREEDEHRIKDIIYFLDTAKKHYASTVELDACIDWLKSLRQRIGE